MRRRASDLPAAAVAVGAMMCGGCAVGTKQAYSGDARPRDQTALLLPSSDVAGDPWFYPVTVDGVRPGGLWRVSDYEILPGLHVVGVGCDLGGGLTKMSLEPRDVVATFEAGATYRTVGRLTNTAQVFEPGIERIDGPSATSGER